MYKGNQLEGIKKLDEILEDRKKEELLRNMVYWSRNHWARRPLRRAHLRNRPWHYSPAALKTLDRLLETARNANEFLPQVCKFGFTHEQIIQIAQAGIIPSIDIEKHYTLNLLAIASSRFFQNANLQSASDEEILEWLRHLSNNNFRFLIKQGLLKIAKIHADWLLMRFLTDPVSA